MATEKQDTRLLLDVHGVTLFPDTIIRHFTSKPVTLEDIDRYYRIAHANPTPEAFPTNLMEALQTNYPSIISEKDLASGSGSDEFEKKYFEGYEQKPSRVVIDACRKLWEEYGILITFNTGIPYPARHNLMEHLDPLLRFCDQDLLAVVSPDPSQGAAPVKIATNILRDPYEHVKQADDDIYIVNTTLGAHLTRHPESRRRYSFMPISQTEALDQPHIKSQIPLLYDQESTERYIRFDVTVDRIHEFLKEPSSIS
jgi:hypothetical protein